MVGLASKFPQMNTMKVLVHESFEFGGFCTWPSWSVHHDKVRLGAGFVKKWNSWFLRCDGWISCQMCPNEYHESLGARKFCVQWVLQMAMLVGAPRQNLMAWWGVLWKIEIRGFWDVMVGLASKCAQMNTMKVLVHEIFEFSVFCTWPSWSVHHGIARWFGGEFCEKLKFVVFEMWWLDWPPNVPKWIPLKSWCTKVLSSVGFAHGQVGRCTTA